MSLPDDCTECGEVLIGLGICDGCGHDNRTSSGAGPSLPEPSEAEIQLAIRRYLDAHGFFVIDTSQGQRAQITRGLPDLLIYGDGRFCHAEIKRPGGQQSPHQKTVARWCRRAHVAYVVWRSVEDARAWVEEGASASVSTPGGAHERG